MKTKEKSRHSFQDKNQNKHKIKPISWHVAYLLIPRSDTSSVKSQINIFPRTHLTKIKTNCTDSITTFSPIYSNKMVMSAS